MQKLKNKEVLTKVEEMIYSRKITCPICNNKFTSMKVKESKLRVEEPHTDLFIQYKGNVHPLQYNAVVCPMCGYAALDNKFDKILPRHKEIIKEKVVSKWMSTDYTKQRTIDESIVCFKLALYSAEQIGAKKMELAGMCLKIGWLYRIKENEEKKDDTKNDREEKRFLRLSAELYEKAFTTEDSDMDEITLMYLIGETYRRLGEVDKAVNWLGKVISSPYIRSNPKIEKLAREQWQEIKELTKEESSEE